VLYSVVFLWVLLCQQRIGDKAELQGCASGIGANMAQTNPRRAEMDWLYKHGFLSWDMTVIVLVIVYMSWKGWKHSKTPAGKKQKARDDEIKQLARRLREEKKSRR
jgi:hypothetical protein